MPGLAKKLVVVAAVEGLIVHQFGQRNQRSLQIKYITHEISTLPHSRLADSLSSAEFHGIVGLLTVAPVSYLVTILSREQVALIRGYPIYVVTDVALIPLSSQSEAKTAIIQAQASLKKSGQHGAPSPDGDTSDDDETHVEAGQREHEDQTSPISSGSSTKEDSSAAHPLDSGNTSSVAEDVIGKKGQYGRFAERWFSKKGWTTEKRRTQGMSVDGVEKSGISSGQGTALDDPPSKSTLPATTLDGAKNDDQTSDSEIPNMAGQSDTSDISSASVTNTLLPKLLRTTRMLLKSRSFFFSYELDLTRRLGTNDQKGSEIPLHKSVDPLYFWNRHLALPFIDGGHHMFVLPLMQGFVGQRAFTVKRQPDRPSEALVNAEEDPTSVIEAQREDDSARQASNFLITLISRRSITRPGLRYLRRGVDDAGDTANSVETEQILSKASWEPSENVYSFTQIRGSIPLFFSQSPYSFKPVPVLQHSSETNHVAFRRHFSNIIGIYGDIQIVLLVDKHGGEAEIGRKYEDHTREFNAKDSVAGHKLGFEWFDFHAVCRGMKFENVSLLMDTLGDTLDAFGETVDVGGIVSQRQSGVLRTNCMDCLDRTNVVQSACGQRALEKQLQKEGVTVDLRKDVTTAWFNTLWADNGDSISRQYANSAALKGDYTRTRQRNYRGAISDLGLTLSRYFNNIISDYFSQAAIDYLLGNVNAQVFEEFETDMMSGDPGLSMQKVRANAIETSSKIVIADQREDMVGGWTLLSPREQNTVKTFPFEETILLVTDKALYRVSFDFNIEKVSSFERVDLRSITGIVRGTYITSTLTAAQADESRNVGLVIKYRPGKEDIARVNTRSLSSAVDLGGGKEAEVEGVSSQDNFEEEVSKSKILAFKALPARSSFIEGQEKSRMSEKEVVNSICDEVQRAVLDGHSTVSGFVEDRDIVSLQEAKKNTGLLEQWGHSLKKMVWA